ncbi:SHOCT domain-containing protein [Haladaptatus cibarius]|uniref:SHOCT domain-containing protein n=1 Tax=Haladaptatus cibarius TaxID=453847 RepID=UPI0006792862|nr:SHOCT domain-containing protein [Haladaptatus cibarius]
MGLFDRGSGSEYREEAKKLVANAQSESVTMDILTQTKGSTLGIVQYFNDGPLITHLETGEQPHFIYRSMQPLKTDDGEKFKFGVNYRNFVAITDRRVIFATPSKDGDLIIPIPYDSITLVRIAPHGSTRFSGVDRVFEITTDEKTYTFNSDRNLTDINDNELLAMAEYVVKQNDDIELVDEVSAKDEAIDDADPSGDEDVLDENVIVQFSGGTLRIPNLETGGDQEIHNPGRPTWTKAATIKGNDYETRLKEVKVTIDEVYIRAGTPEKGIAHMMEEQEITRRYYQIEAVDYKSGYDHGMHLHSGSLVYQLEFPSKKVEKEKIMQAIEYIRDRIEEEQTEHSRSEEDPDSDEGRADPLEKLERLSALYENGALSDEEFETKKAELLEQI